MATAIMMLTSCGLFAQNSQNSKKLVMYFSWGGTTEKMAKMISSSNGGELFKIEPTKAYPTSYTPCTEVVKEELDNGIFRQVKKAPDFSKYDTIFVGVPVWWHTAPTLMTHSRRRLRVRQSFHSARIRLLTARKRFRQLWMQLQLPVIRKAMTRQIQIRTM